MADRATGSKRRKAVSTKNHGTIASSELSSVYAGVPKYRKWPTLQNW
jgi:hypothetical protein